MRCDNCGVPLTERPTGTTDDVPYLWVCWPCFLALVREPPDD